MMSKKPTFVKTSADKPIIIIGAGPTGLAAGLKLSQNGHKVIILEHQSYIGGLSASFRRQDFYYELGPHVFHLKDLQITEWLKKILKKDFCLVPTRTKVIIDNQYLEYPLQANELLRKISLWLGLRILLSYSLIKFKQLFRQRPLKSFEDWGKANFGTTLYKISFGDYTKKVWGIDPNRLSAKLASQKLFRLNLGDIIKKLFGIKGVDQPAYFKKFLYPPRGESQIFDLMAKEILKNKGIIMFNAQVIGLKRNRSKITKVEYLLAGSRKTIDAESVISSMPLKDIITIFKPAFSQKIISSSKALKYRDMIIIYLVIDRDSLSKDQWVYLVERKFQFNRYANSKNLSAKFAPKGKTVLAFEICCQQDDQLWRSNNQDIIAMVKNDLDKLNWSNLTIDDVFIRKIVNGYPIFLIGYQEKLRDVLESLAELDNLISTGRNGLFLNSDIHDSFLMGHNAAELIINRRYSADKYYQEQINRC